MDIFSRIAEAMRAIQEDIGPIYSWIIEPAQYEGYRVYPYILKDGKKVLQSHRIAHVNTPGEGDAEPYIIGV